VLYVYVKYLISSFNTLLSMSDTFWSSEGQVTGQGKSQNSASNCRLKRRSNVFILSNFWQYDMHIIIITVFCWGLLTFRQQKDHFCCCGEWLAHKANVFSVIFKIDSLKNEFIKVPFWKYHRVLVEKDSTKRLSYKSYTCTYFALTDVLP